MSKAIFVPIIGGFIAIGSAVALFNFGFGPAEKTLIFFSAATVGSCFAIAAK
jgi:hypothetical protein